MVTNNSIKKIESRQKRHWKLRKRVSGTVERPRLVVFRSLKHIYAQIVDDVSGKTLISASTIAKDYLEDNKDGKSKKTEQSFQVGLFLGKKAISAGIEKICFDRGGYKYHGRVKALADGVRKAGVSF